MKYLKFDIRNYKGISKLVLDLSRDKNFKIFTLVGLNESGKTTILEAVDFFQKDIPEDERHSLIPKNKKTNFKGSISVTAELELDKKDEDAIKKFAETIGFLIKETIGSIVVDKHYYYENSKYTGKGKTWTMHLKGRTKRGKIDKHLDSNNTKYIQIREFINKKLLPPIIYYPNFLFGFPDRIYLESSDKDPKEQSFYKQVIQDVLDSLNNDLNIQDHLVQRMESNTEEDQEALESVVNKMGRQITGIILNPWDKIFKFNAQQRTGTSNREIIIKDGRDEEDRYYIDVKLKIGSDQYHIKELSLGFRWFFAFLLFTEFRKNRTQDKGEILFLIDEPASNLHSTAQNRLLETFNELISRSKLIYTTHSHHLIKSNWLEGAFIVRNKILDYNAVANWNSPKTDIEAIPYRQFVAKYPDQETYFKPILDSLDYKPSDLEMVPNIIIVEGKNDFYTLQYINEVILNNKYKIYKFYPGNGAGKNEKIIRLYISWAKDFLVLMDSDNAGKAAQKKYIREIGKLISKRVFTLKDITSSWDNFTTESLFSTAEKMRIINSIYPTARVFSKSKFNNAIQNLLFSKQKEKINKATLNNFEKVFKFLKTNLK